MEHKHPTVKVSVDKFGLPIDPPRDYCFRCKGFPLYPGPSVMFTDQSLNLKKEKPQWPK